MTLPVIAGRQTSISSLSGQSASVAGGGGQQLAASPVTDNFFAGLAVNKSTVTRLVLSVPGGEESLFPKDLFCPGQVFP